MGDAINPSIEYQLPPFPRSHTPSLWSSCSGGKGTGSLALLEFFVALKFAAELGALPADFTALAQADLWLDDRLAPEAQQWSDYFQRHVDDSGNVVRKTPLDSFMPECMEDLGTTVGKAPLSRAILTLLATMTDSENLWKTLVNTKGCDVEELGCVGGM